MEDRYFISAKTFLLEDGIRHGGYLEVTDGMFGRYFDELQQADLDAAVRHYKDCTVAPGLFDTHIHGVSGFDVMDATVEALQTISRDILKYGVTRFLPTTLTDSVEHLNDAVRSIYEATLIGEPGAKIEGIF